MKVCLVNSFYPPYVGGAETYVSNLAKEFTQMGHNVTVYCANRPVGSGGTFQDKVLVRRMKTPLTFYGTPLTIFPSDFFQGDYDVIHCNFPNPYFTIMSAWVSKVTGTPAVLTWHNDLPPVTSAASFLVGLHDLLARRYLDAYQTIIATTETYVRSSKLLQRYAKKVRVIANGVDSKRFHPNVDGGRVKEKHRLSGCKVALFVGALTPWHGYKGIDILLQAFQMASKNCDEMRLLIVGGGSMIGVYRQLAYDLGIGKKVIFAGQIDSSILPMYYAASDFLVLSSRDRSEGFGLVLLEAMASGKPVIATRVGGVVDVVEDGVTGLLVEPKKPDELAKATITICKNTDLRNTMGVAGRRFAERQDWAYIAKQVEILYSVLK